MEVTPPESIPDLDHPSGDDLEVVAAAGDGAGKEPDVGVTISLPDRGTERTSPDGALAEPNEAHADDWLNRLLRYVSLYIVLGLGILFTMAIFGTLIFVIHRRRTGRIPNPLVASPSATATSPPETGTRPRTLSTPPPKSATMGLKLPSQKFDPTPKPQQIRRLQELLTRDLINSHADTQRWLSVDPLCPISEEATAMIK